MTFPRRIYFHIGAGKTGTSALQFFFEKNKRLLKSHGIEYPLGHGMNIQNRFACSLRGSPSSRRRFPDMESDVKECNICRLGLGDSLVDQILPEGVVGWESFDSGEIPETEIAMSGEA